MSGRYFLDTNILIYQFDDRDLRKKEIALHLLREGARLHLGVISYHVIQEFDNTMFRKFPSELSPEDSEQYLVKVLRRLQVVDSSVELTNRHCSCTAATNSTGTTAS